MSSNKKYLIVGIVTTLILALGFSLAYFAPIIRGEGKKITVRTGSLAIVFTDSVEITEEEITPGWTTSKTFTVENESNVSYYYNINLRDVVNTFVTEGFLQYKITSTNGYNMDNFEPITKEDFQSLGEGIEIGGLETQEYTIYFRYVDSETIDQSADMNKEFSGYLSITEGEKPQFPKGSLGEKLLIDNPNIQERTNFSTVFTEGNTRRLYKATGNETEDGSDVYYFAGNAYNNWIKFGKDQNNADLYWRIIRTNEDGGVRLLYIGPDKATNSAYIKLDGTLQEGVAFNSISGNTMYVGYMYGTTGSLANNRTNTISSSIKQIIDKWYSKTLNINTDSSNNTYDAYVSRTAIYCNDRSGDGYTSSGEINYAAKKRLVDAKSPSYKCGNNASRSLYSDANVADKFSASTASGGNGKLMYPIALMTVDEIAYAGGVYYMEAPAWYYYNSSNSSATNRYWWTMSPFSGNGDGFIFHMRGSSYPAKLDYMRAYETNPGIRPVLSLKSCVKYVSGDGSSNTPYEVSVDSTCANKEN